MTGSGVTIVGPGTTTLTARQEGGANFGAAVEVMRTLVVNPIAPVFATAPATVPTAIRDGSFTYGPITLTARSLPATFGVTGLPPGLSFLSGSSLGSGGSDLFYLAGTPTAEGTFNATVTATNVTGTATKTIALVVNPKAPVITSSAAASAVAGSPFSYTVTVLPATGVTFSAADLPAWLSFNAATGLLSGTPPEASPSVVRLSATNVTGAATLPLFITTTYPANAPVYSGPGFASGTVGAAFSFTPNFGSGPTTYALLGSPLPTGLTFSTATGAVTGIPQQFGYYRLRIAATRAGLTASAGVDIGINPAVAAPYPNASGGMVHSASSGTAFGPITLSATTSAGPFGAPPPSPTFTIGTLPPA